MKSLGLIFAVASLLIFLITTPVNAGVEVLSPYTGIVWNAGETEQITWKENGNSPALTSLKKLTITLMIGTQESQSPVVVIATNVDGTALTYSYTVPKNVGPEANNYFLKFSQDTNLYFSGYFTIKGVSGKVPNVSSTGGAAPGTSTDSSSSTGTSTATTSLNSTKTSTSTKTDTSSTLTDLTTSTKTGDAAKSNSGPTTTQSPVAKSSGGNNLVASVSTLSITLFAIALYLF